MAEHRRRVYRDRVKRPGPELFPVQRSRRWWHAGPSRRQKITLDIVTFGFAILLAGGYGMGVVESRRGPNEAGAAPEAEPETPMAEVRRQVGSALLDRRANSTSYVDEAALAFLEPLRGESGKVRAVFRQPGGQVANPKDGVGAVYEEEHEHGAAESDDFRAPNDPGIYKLAVELGKARKEISDLRVITMVPFSEKKNERVGLYYLGSWPYESGGIPRSASYGNPAGFIEVTKENRNTKVSEHLRLGDFLTKDQANVWPKYLVLEPKLIDKIELIVAEIEKTGKPVDRVFVMSGFRTPRYNKGGGNTGGRASLSRHMYGDAADIYIDNNGDGYTDDITGDGKVDVKDAEFIAAAAERVEKRYPALTGGIGIYPACCGHGPFTHIDTRGNRARWRGTGNG